MTQPLPEQALHGLSPELLRRYLTAQGWYLGQEQPRAEVWATELPEGRMEVLLPKDPRLADFVRQIRYLLESVADAEDREPAAILRDVHSTQTDVHSVRLLPQGLPSGTVWLAEGSRAVTALRDLFVSAVFRASASRRRQPTQPVEPGRKPNHVYDFLSSRVLLGLPQPGSYILTAEVPLSSRVPEQLTLDEQGMHGGTPLARKVSDAFYGGAAAAHAAAAHAAGHDGDLSSFAEHTEQGLSANVCEALASMSSEGRVPFVLRTAWANGMPKSHAPGALDFRPELAAQLQRGAQYLRERFGRQDVAVRGFVTKMEREATTGPGKIILSGRLDDQPEARAMRVYLDLDSATYDQVGHAHLGGQEVVFQGDLERIGNRWQMVRIRNWRVENMA